MPQILRFILEGRPPLHSFQHATGLRAVVLDWVRQADPALSQIYERIRGSLADATEPSEGGRITLQALAGMLPWMLLGLAFARSARKDPSANAAFVGLVAIGILCGVGAMFLPASMSPLTRLLFLPWVCFLAFVVLAVACGEVFGSAKICV